MPDPSEIATFLLDTSLELSPETAAELAAGMHTIRLQADEFLFLKGSVTDRFFVVVEGKLEIQASSIEGKELVFTVKGPGDTIGEAAIIDATPRTASVRAATPATLYVIGRPAFLSLATRHASLAMALARAAAESLRRESTRVEQRAFAPLAPRLADHLVREGQADARGRLVVRATQQMLADRMGVTRESVNKTLRLWEESGIVELQRGAVQLIAPERFSAMNA